MSQEQLVEMARHNRELARSGTVDLVDQIVQVPARNYYDPTRWKLEMDRIFKRLPLTLAFSVEVPKPGDYKAMEVAGTPVLIVRGVDGIARAFVNTCSHRGSQIVPEGTGSARRFTCPYHAWTYDRQGVLVGILDREMFGDLDMSCNGLTKLTTAERVGLIFVTLDPHASVVDIDTYLCGYDDVLQHLDFTSCRVVGRQSIAGPNWKVAYDGYLDLYHLPILHKDTFGTAISNKATYFPWGPHQRVASPARTTTEVFGDLAESEWPTERLTLGVWTIFPHISVASFDAGGRVLMVSQLFPGDDPGSSVTVQTFLHTQPEAPGQAEKVAETMAFLHHVVQDEDYATGLRLQKALRTGAKEFVMFGRNEGGGQRFHRWVDALLETDDADLASLFKGNAPG